MNPDTINNVIEFINNEFPSEAEELCSAIDLLVETITELNEKIEDKRHNKYEGKQFREIFDLYRNQSLALYDIIDTLNEYIENLTPDFDMSDSDDMDDSISELLNVEDNSKEQATILKRLDIPDYKDARLNADTSVRHTLYENFTFKRPCAFEIQGTTIDVSQWREMLIKTCEYLYNLDGGAKVFDDIILSDNMNGRKRRYFSRNKSEIASPLHIGNSDIYVIGNLSANDIRDLVAKLLNKFRIPKKNFSVYIQRDLSSLHHISDNTVKQLEINMDSDAEKSVDSELKIGEYAQSIFNNLFNQRIPEQELANMQNKDWSLRVLGISYPLLKKRVSGIPDRAQMIVSGHNRYYKRPVIVNGEVYFLCSQWFENPCRSKLNEWLAKRGTQDVKITSYYKIRYNTYCITVEEEILKAILTSFSDDLIKNVTMNVSRIRDRYSNIIAEKTKYKDSPQTVIYCLVGKLTEMKVIELAPHCKKGKYILTDGSMLSKIIDNPKLISE